MYMYVFLCTYTYSFECISDGLEIFPGRMFLLLYTFNGHVYSSISIRTDLSQTITVIAINHIWQKHLPGKNPKCPGSPPTVRETHLQRRQKRFFNGCWRIQEASFLLSETEFAQRVKKRSLGLFPIAKASDLR